MIDLERQIRDYYDQIIIPVTNDEYTQSVTGRPVPVRRSRAWALAAAFVVVLVGVGVTELLLGGNGSSLRDQPELTPVDVPGHSSTTVTDQSTSATTGDVSVPAGWERVAVGEPWVDYIVDVEAVPNGGGFVIRAADAWSVFWSPDGVEWFDADPTRQVPADQRDSADGRTGAQVIAATSDRVAVLDQINTGLWIGDPQTGVWEQIRFDTEDFAGDVELLAVKSNDKELLALASVNGLVTLDDESVDPDDEPSPIPGIDKYIVWVVDLDNDTVEPYPLPIAAHRGQVDATVVEWFNRRWVIYLANEEESLLASPDGVSWTKTAAPEEWRMSLTSLTAGSTTMMATVCNFGGDSFWYSEDGVNWFNSSTSHIGHHSTYSGELGFVVVYGGDSPMLVSPDGRSWQSGAGTPVSGVVFLDASGNMLLVGDGLRPDETPMLWLRASE